MNIPFAYGKIVEDVDFTDRTDESSHLLSNFVSLTNTAIISPRRWRKPSLVAKAIKAAKDFLQLEKDFPNFHFHLALDRLDLASDAQGVEYTAGFKQL